MNVAPRLACQQCKQRKLRCDKGTPCSACRAAGLICQVVQRARLPRGKSGQSRKQKQTLESRLRQLETLVEQHNGVRNEVTVPIRSANFERVRVLHFHRPAQTAQVLQLMNSRSWLRISGLLYPRAFLVYARY